MQGAKRLCATWFALLTALLWLALPVWGAARPPEIARAKPNPTLAAASEKRFIIILQSSSDPMEQLKASIPAEFQDFEVFNTHRTSEGKMLYDICLGHFATLAEAERAQRTLLRRFPNASVIPVKPALPANAPLKGQ